MTTIFLPLVVVLGVVALVVYGLERNHRRRLRPASRLAGSTHVEDRDLPRVATEWHATTTHSLRERPAPHRSTAQVRSIRPA